ncbi:MAG: xanthine dehydrogenase family protein subunit M [Armatimonadetes bacterium]|nr:MAG: xanthine dehydrogenase family protein subunit M [Armatimonadota bacterium]
MNNFAWVEPKSLEDASNALKSGGAALAGGIELLCLLKDSLLEPPSVVNLKSLPGLREIQVGERVEIGALARLVDIAEHAQIAQDYRVLAQAAESVGSPQIRNVGTLGGNLCQRPRCWYFRDAAVHCLKKGGPKCYAVGGDNEYHAILGGGPCYIVHPSDLAPALITLEATVHTNLRELPIEQFFRLPSQRLDHETALEAGEIVTSVSFPADRKTWKSYYFKMRERDSFDWALSSCAVALKMNGNRIEDARVALGGVAPIPWRSKEAEAALRGKDLSEAVAEAAGRAAVAMAEPMSENRYKVSLTANVVKIAILEAVK